METLGIEQLPDFAHFLSKFHNIYSTTHISSFCSLCEVHLTFLEADSWVQESTSWKPRLSDQRLSVCFDRSSLFWVAQHVLLQKTTCWLKILGKRWRGTCPQMPISPEEATQTQPRTAYCPGFCWNCNFGGSFMQFQQSQCFITMFWPENTADFLLRSLGRSSRTSGIEVLRCWNFHSRQKVTVRWGHVMICNDAMRPKLHVIPCPRAVELMSFVRHCCSAGFINFKAGSASSTNVWAVGAGRSVAVWIQAFQPKRSQCTLADTESLIYFESLPYLFDDVDDAQRMLFPSPKIVIGMGIVP